MKASAIIRIIAFSLAIILLSFILLSVLDHNYYIESGRVHSYEDLEMEQPVETIQQDVISSQVKNIEIEWLSGNVTIRSDPTVQGIMITESRPQETEYQMVCKQSGQTLKIKFCEESIKLSSFGVHVDVNKDLFIAVPSDWSANSIEIDAAAAKVNIHDLSINELDFDGASGNLILDNCNVSELDIDTASGDVEFVGTLEHLDFDAASAKFYCEFREVPQKLDMDSMSGDLELVLPPNAGFTCYIDGLSSNFSSDFQLSNTGGTYVHGDGACRIDVSCLSGDVEILKGVEANN